MNTESIKEVSRSILLKMLSARWILTLIVGLTFSYMCINQLEISPYAQSITTMVYVLYFTRNDRSNQSSK